MKTTNDPTFKEIMDEQYRKLRKSKNEHRKLLRGHINITGLFRHLDENTYWEPEGIVDIEFIDDTQPGYHLNQHARIKGEEPRRLYEKMTEDDIRGIDHYYVWQMTGYLGDDYSGWMLYPLKDGRYFKVYYNC